MFTKEDITQALNDLKVANAKIQGKYRYPCGLEKTINMKENGARIFFNSPDGQNHELYYGLRELGWRNAGYSAEYYWKVWKGFMEIDYTEGDVDILEHKVKGS